jgi:hypothetical protein
MRNMTQVIKSHGNTTLAALTLLFVMGCGLLQASDEPARGDDPAQINEAIQPPEESPADSAQDPAGAGKNCINLYYPVVQGASYIYSTTSDWGEPFSYKSIIEQVRTDGFTLTIQYPDVAVTQEWACRPEGLVALAYGGGPAGSLTAPGTSAQFETTLSEGVTLPVSISPGDKWKQSFFIEGTQSMGGETALTQGTVNYSFTAVGEEGVTVPAGAFWAMKIQVETSFDLQITVQGLTVPVFYGSSGFFWYNTSSGLVKISESGDFLDEPYSATVELVSESFP